MAHTYIGVSQSGQFNFSSRLSLNSRNKLWPGIVIQLNFCNADLVTKFTKIELVRTTSFWHVSQNDWKVLRDEKIFISSGVSLPKVFFSKN